MFCAPTADETGDGASDTGDTEEIEDDCVPYIPDDEIGQEYACQGIGNGWLVLDVFGAGVQPPECVNWGDDKPENPTAADCMPLDLTMLPSDVPSPGACCIEAAKPAPIEKQCREDCGFAACKLAIIKIREAALALPHAGSQGVKKIAEERVRSDLFGFANNLELPKYLEICANAVAEANGKPADILLGAGMSLVDTIGHINNATLTLQCTLDVEDPYILDGGTCESAPNIPLIEGESHFGGVAETGAISMFAPNGGQTVALSNITFEYSELHKHDGSTDLVLTTFDADAADVAHGEMSFLAPHIHLAAPISAPLVGDRVMFPAGSLRMEVSGVIVSDGEALFGGTRSSGTYVNTGAAIGIRSPNGGFALVDAPFEVEGYRFVLSTEAGSGTAR